MRWEELTKFRAFFPLLLLLLGLGVGAGAGVFSPGESTQNQVVGQRPNQRTEDQKRQFVAFLLDDAQSVWKEEFARQNRTYRNAMPIMFMSVTPTACGQTQAVTGPFYCALDGVVHIDLSFNAELDDFAQAYVIAHAIGHHVQNQLGIRGASVPLELQADCFAGVWAHTTNQRALVEAGNIDEALAAAATASYDRLQQPVRGVIAPESWTHASSAQRSRWFKIGYRHGEMSACDTFSANLL